LLLSFHHVSTSASKFSGGHSMKFGGEYRKNFLDYAQPGYPSGQYVQADPRACY